VVYSGKRFGFERGNPSGEFHTKIRQKKMALISSGQLFLVVLIGLVVVLAMLTSPVSAARKMKPPIKSEESNRKNRRSVDCHFGKKVYELEETWHPDLGSPFGTMYCIRCECIAVQKKRRIRGRTLCRNIKNECPKPTCDEPVLLPGRCCKVCLKEGDGGLGALKEDVSHASEADEDKQSRDFAALLTQKTSSKGTSSLSSMATGRFTFHKRHLYFSLVLPSTTSQLPRFLHFLGDNGDILEEQQLEPNDYFNATGKICGVWRKVPRVYKKLLRTEKLWVALMDDRDGEAITGRVSRYKALSTELLSAVLVPTSPSCPGCAGTAAISMASASNSIHVTVAAAGVAAAASASAPKGAVDVNTLVVRLETLETNGSPARLIEELITVQKPQEVNLIEVRTVLEPREMRLLLRGQLILTVYAKRNPEQKLRGAIGPRIACDIFDSLITSDGSLQQPIVPTTATGLAWMFIGKDGNFNYRVLLRGLSSSVTKITLESGALKSKRPRVVEDLTNLLSDNWINGTISNPTPRDLEQLYEGDMYINVATDVSESEIRGRLEPRLASPSHLGTENGPILMNAVNGSRAALGWVHVDQECNFHYDVIIGQDAESLASASRRDPIAAPTLTIIELVDLPRLSISSEGSSRIVGPSGITLMDASEAGYTNGNIPFMPNIRLLDEFAGSQVENSVGDLNKLSLSRMNAGVAYLKVTEPPQHEMAPTEFQGWLTNLQVPSTCLPFTASAMHEADGAEEPSLGPGYVFDRQDDNEIPQTSRCFYEGKLFDDGKQWTAVHDRCMMCSCQRGRVVCDHVICPALNCGSASIVQPNGECCPMCQNVTSRMESSVDKASRPGCEFDGDNKFHPAGSRWHPYLPPFGFSKCAVCVCDAVTLKVECSKLTCPPLSCPDSEAYRPDPMACCKQCPPTPAPTTPASALAPASVNKETLLLDEEAQVRTEIDILSLGGCRFKGDVFENGEEWHPRIQPWGEMRCINCNCKDGKVKCKRKKCLKSRCTGKSPMGRSSVDACCPACPEDGSDAVSSPISSPRINSSKKKRVREGRRNRQN